MKNMPRVIAVGIVALSLSINAGDKKEIVRQPYSLRSAFKSLTKKHAIPQGKAVTEEKKDLPFPQAKFDPLNLMAKDIWTVVNGYASLQLAKERKLKAHDKDIRCVAWSPDGQQFASANNSGIVYLWNATTHAKVRTLFHRDNIQSVDYSPTGSLLVTGGGEGPSLACLKLWNVQNGKKCDAWNYMHGTCNRAVFDREGKRIACARIGDATTPSQTFGDSLNIWDVEHKEQLVTFDCKSCINDMLWLHDPFLCVSVGLQSKVRLWDIRTRGQVGALGNCNTHPGGQQIAITLNDNILIWPNREGALTVFDRTANKKIQTICTPQKTICGVRSVQLSKDDQKIVTVVDDTMYLLDRKSGDVLESRKSNENVLHAAVWSPDERSILTATFSGNIYHYEQQGLFEFLSS